MTISSVLSVCFATDSWSSVFFVYDQEVWGLREDPLPPRLRLLKERNRAAGLWGQAGY